MVKLAILNIFRWVKEYFLFWSFLFFAYAFMVRILTGDLRFLQILILLSGFIFAYAGSRGFSAKYALPIPGLNFFGTSGFFLTSRLRNPIFLLSLLISLAVLVFVVGADPILFSFLLVANFQLDLHTARKWAIVLFYKKSGGYGNEVARGFLFSALLRGSILGFVYLVFGHAPVSWETVAAMVVGVAFAMSAVIFEGDVGRPILINLITTAVGLMAVTLILQQILMVVLVVLVSLQLMGGFDRRIRSVPLWDEDAEIS